MSRRAAPWLWVVGPLVAVIFPPSIPLLIAAAVWQMSDGGENVRAYLEARQRQADPAGSIRRSTASMGPLPTGPDTEPLEATERVAYLLDRGDEEIAAPRPRSCVRCFQPAQHSPRRNEWRHVTPSDTCSDPALVLKGGLHG